MNEHQDKIKNQADKAVLQAKLKSESETINMILEDLVALYKRNPKKYKVIKYLLEEWQEKQKEIYEKNWVVLFN